MAVWKLIGVGVGRDWARGCGGRWHAPQRRGGGLGRENEKWKENENEE